jgi:hypothetical protein
MKKEFLTYLNAINTTQTVQNRVAMFYNLCQNICTEDLVDIFVDDYVNQDGSISYTGLSFFSKNFTLSIPNFLTSDIISILGNKVAVQWFRLQIRDYDFKKGNDQSRISMDLMKGITATGYYKGSRNNCDFLLEIMKKYLLPNI